MSRGSIVWGTLVVTFVAIVVLLALAGALPNRLNVVFGVVIVPSIYVIAALVAARLTGVESWSTLIGPGTHARAVLLWMAGALALEVALKGVYLGLAWLSQPESLAGVKLLAFRWPGFSYGMIRSFIGSPVSEEMLARGFLISFYEKNEVAPFRFGRLLFDGPNVVSSLAFTLFHIANGDEDVVSLAMIFVISMFLGKAKRKTGGLLAPMLCHGVFNFVGATVLAVVPV